MKNINEECLSLALSIAREVIQKEINTDSLHLSARLQSTLSNLSSPKAIKIFVNEKDRVAIQKNIRAEFPSLNAVITESCDIERGNAEVKTISGTIKLNWEEHLGVIRKHLQESLRDKLYQREENAASFSS